MLTSFYLACLCFVFILWLGCAFFAKRLFSDFSKVWYTCGWDVFTCILSTASLSNVAFLTATFGFYAIPIICFGQSLKILLVGLICHFMQKQHNVQSLSHFLFLKYGRTAQVFYSVVALINTVALLSLEFVYLNTIFGVHLKFHSKGILILISTLSIVGSSFSPQKMAFVSGQITGICALLFLYLLNYCIYAEIQFEFSKVISSSISRVWVLCFFDVVNVVFFHPIWYKMCKIQGIHLMGSTLFASGLYTFFTFVIAISSYIFSVFKLQSTPNEYILISLERYPHVVLSILLHIGMMNGTFILLQTTFSALLGKEILANNPPILSKLIVIITNYLLISFAAAEHKIQNILIWLGAVNLCCVAPILFALVLNMKKSNRIMQSAWISSGITLSYAFIRGYCKDTVTMSHLLDDPKYNGIYLANCVGIFAVCAYVISLN